VRRRLFNLAAAVSLVLCVATAALWVRSYRASETAEWTREWVKHGLCVSRGTLRYHKYERRMLPFTDYYPRGFGRRTGPPIRVDQASPHGPDDVVYWDTLGFRFIASAQKNARPSGSLLFLDFPCWALVLIFMPLPAWWAIRAGRTIRRTWRHRCPTCGYDVRATPDRCPECGAVPSSRA
jgi:hypothetical protein